MDSKSFFAMIALFLSLFVSCDKEDQTAAVIEEVTFEGTWIKSAVETINCNDPAENIDKRDHHISNVPCSDRNKMLCYYERYIFDRNAFIRKFDETFLFIPSTRFTSGTYTLEGNSLELCVGSGSDVTECSNATMTIVNGTLALSFVNENTACAVTTYYTKE